MFRQKQGGSCAKSLHCDRNRKRLQVCGAGSRSVDAAAWSLLSELELVERRAKSGTRGFSPDSLGRSWVERRGPSALALDKLCECCLSLQQEGPHHYRIVLLEEKKFDGGFERDLKVPPSSKILFKGPLFEFLCLLSISAVPDTHVA